MWIYNGKRNEKGKEYNFNKELIFEGEYFNGYRIKGKEYFKKKLEFEGDYLLNKKWNGKGYDAQGKVIYELKNGNGKVKEYNYFDNLIFEGEYLNGIKWTTNGPQKSCFMNGLYELKQEKGFRKEECGNQLYMGECFDEKFHGIVKINYGAAQYEGDYKLKKREGYGKFYFNNGNMYEGEFKNNRFEGIWIFNFANGDRYEGKFKNGNYEGYGIFYFSSGFKYEGYFKKGFSKSILFITYKILSIIKKKLSTVNRNTTILILIFTLILGLLINYKFK